MGKRKERSQIQDSKDTKKSATKKHKKSKQSHKKDKQVTVKQESNDTRNVTVSEQQHHNDSQLSNQSTGEQLRLSVVSRPSPEESEDEEPPTRIISQRGIRTRSGSFSYADLVASSAKEDETNDSPIFFRKRVQLTVSLLPYTLHNTEASIFASIRTMLLQYSDGWGGILLAFDNLKIRDRQCETSSKGKGWILNDLPYIHYDVDCDVLVFAPVTGCELQGTVSECFPSHISILVFGYINAMISADSLLKTGIRFDHEEQCWINHHDVSQTIYKGMKINFVVSKIHECEGTLSLEGKCPQSSLFIDG